MFGVSRHQAIRLAAAMMVVLAGCTSGPSPAAPDVPPFDLPNIGKVVSDALDDLNPFDRDPVMMAPVGGGEAPATATETTAPSSTPRANISPETRREAREVAANFYEKLPENRTERRRVSFEAAAQLCRSHRENFDSKLNLSHLKNTTESTGDAARRLEYATQIVRENFNDEVPTGTAAKLRDGVGKVARYAPLIGSYNRLVNASCAAMEERTNESLERFYIAVMVFGVDVVLIHSGAFHGPAFRGTGVITNTARRVGLWRLRSVLGNRGFALAMSEVYDNLRGSMIGASSYVVRKGAEAGMDLNRSDVNWTAVAAMQGVDRSRLLADMNTSDTIGRMSNVTEDAIDCGQDGINRTNVSDGFNLDEVTNGTEAIVNCSTGS